ncbi:hypothetical protein F3Y22_tig00000477pilonHSYRG00099 [Hibiscus syriacus]|uniref:CCHC-type domain-containing protein n=1 Tax=Hibiscus syriacus TaxID=106335 RepID=A0A6A3D6M6_HIBSY|nr:hypothetical protein F3Y22_tig00000477pilonHSYRG00099 [Hibiscus syriacus]
MASHTTSSSTNDPITIQNSQDPQHPLLTINLSNITKLSSTNYLTWSLQIQSLLEGYDLYHFIDGTQTPPQPTVTVNGVTSLNLEYTTWKRQDRLFFSALLDAISVSLQPLIAHTTTSLDAWQTLANTYAKPYRGHIKQLKEQLKRCNKGSKSISEYMQAIKTRADELALLGKPIDDEDLIDRVLEGLSDEYKYVIDIINARDMPISFAELHEKLLSKEASLQTAQPPSLSLPVTKNPTAFRNHPNWRPSATNSQQSCPTTILSPHDQRQPKPYLGHCQACGTQGHTAKRCPMFWLVTNQQSTTSRPQGSQGYRPSTPWKPRANHAIMGNNTTLTWLLDNGAFHHVTSDLSNLSLHISYQGSDDIMIGDGSTLHITHTGFTTIPTSSRTFTL